MRIWSILVLGKEVAMNTKTYVMVSSVIFTVFALTHLVRLLQGWSVEVGSVGMPLWASGLAVLVGAGIAVWGFSLVRRG
jgi:hypothetical protein